PFVLSSTRKSVSVCERSAHAKSTRDGDATVADNASGDAPAPKGVVTVTAADGDESPTALLATKRKRYSASASSPPAANVVTFAATLPAVCHDSPSTEDSTRNPSSSPDRSTQVSVTRRFDFAVAVRAPGAASGVADVVACASDGLESPPALYATTRN